MTVDFTDKNIPYYPDFVVIDSVWRIPGYGIQEGYTVINVLSELRKKHRGRWYTELHKVNRMYKHEDNNYWQVREEAVKELMYNVYLSMTFNKVNLNLKNDLNQSPLYPLDSKQQNEKERLL